jgi:hypothetical protein
MRFATPLADKTPQFTHDCEYCTFIGRYESDGSSYDGWVCAVKDNPSHSSLILRFSDHGGDYLSSPVYQCEKIPMEGQWKLFYELRDQLYVLLNGQGYLPETPCVDGQPW